MPKISIIIPIFNSERYLDRCLNSVLDSTLRDIEIICVDDCSSDRSPEIMEDFFNRDSRIKVIHHSRKRGPGGARNTGIRAASAKYVGGVDSDDWIEPDMFERLLAATGNGEVDIVECGFTQDDPSGILISTYRPVVRKSNLRLEHRSIFSLTKNAFWNKLWRKSLFYDNDIWFSENVLYEDLATTPRLIAKAQDIRSIDIQPYHYVRRHDSITFGFSDESLADYFSCFATIANFLEREGLMSDHRDDFIEFILGNLEYHAENVLASDVGDNFRLRYINSLANYLRDFLRDETYFGEFSKDELRISMLVRRLEDVSDS